MVSKELRDYIQAQREKGSRDEQILEILKESDWKQESIDQVLKDNPLLVAKNVRLVKRADSKPVVSGKDSADSQTQSSEEVDSSIPTAPSLDRASELIERAVEIFQKKWKVIFGVQAVLLPFSIIVTIMSTYYVGTVGLTPADQLPSVPLGVSLVFILMAIPSTILAIWGGVALLTVIVKFREEIGVIDAYKRSMHLILPYLFTALLVGGVAIFGFLCFFIPAIIFGVWFAFTYFVLAEQNVFGPKAMLISKKYVEGRFFEVFGKLLLGGAMVFGVSMLTSVLMNPLAKSFMDKSMETMIAGQLVIMGITWVVNIVAQTIGMIYTFLIYENLKDLCKGKDFVPSTGSQGAIGIGSILGYVAFLLFMFWVSLVLSVFMFGFGA